MKSVAAVLRKRVRARNRELVFEAIVEIVLGMVYCVLLYGAIFWVAWMGTLACIMPWLGGYDLGKTTLIAGAVTALCFLVCCYAAWRNAGPLRHVEPMSDVQFEVMVRQMRAGVGPMVTEHAAAGMGELLIAGPRNFFSSLERVAHRIRANRRTMTMAAELLERIGPGLDLSEVDEGSSRALGVLRRLALIKLGGMHETQLMLTSKGEDVLNGK